MNSSKNLKICRVKKLTLLLGLLSWSIGSSSVTTCGRSGTTSSSWGGTTTGSNVGQEVLDILTLEGLGEEGGPDGLDVRNFGGGDERLELVGLLGEKELVGAFLSGGGCASAFEKCRMIGMWTYGNLQTLIGEDEGGV